MRIHRRIRRSRHLTPRCSKDYKSPLTGETVLCVAAGGIADGRGVAAALSCVFIVQRSCCALTARRYGAAGVWVGTRFVASEEAGAPKLHKELVLKAGCVPRARGQHARALD